ncbi:prepilin-type N-terminal cleavage/methylation domain-containing protein [Candidatus Daviesbacteria bacterium]|nr:prepilin-type N-terminal cleavage/methylation domain-containing protein [Candidatus Daviesbacteria bacterium]
MQSARPGFTLIELMVVVSIIAILTAIGAPLFQNVQKNARDAKRLSDIQSVQKALEQHYVTNNGYPWWNNYAIKDYENQLGKPSSPKGYFVNERIPSDPNPGEVSSGGSYPIGYTYYEYTYYNCLNSTNLPNNTPDTFSSKYIICAKLANPQGKGNTSVPPADACSATTPGSDYYCLSNSN